jgi:drug/metabolite transporter (DMT)-like permease
VLHAVWNLLLAGARDSEAAAAVALTTSTVICAPIAALWWELEAAAVPYLIASVALEIAYFALLAASYSRAELSVVYPLARGLAPVLVLVGAVAFTQARTSAGQALGVVLVGTGVMLVRGLRRGHGVGFAVVIAGCIAGYTVVDKHGLEYASPLAYLWVITLATGTAYTAGLAATRGPGVLRAALDARSLAAGIASFAAYGLVLAALERAPAAPVAAVRETSVVIATGLAAVVLRERVTLWRFGGAALVAGGIALLSV